MQYIEGTTEYYKITLYTGVFIVGISVSSLLLLDPQLWTTSKIAAEVSQRLLACNEKKKKKKKECMVLPIIGLSHIRVSIHVSTAYRDTKGTSHVRRRYVGIRSSYSSIRSSYSSYAEVLRFLCVHLKIRSTYVAGPIRRTYVTHTWYIRKQRGWYVVDT